MPRGCKLTHILVPHYDPCRIPWRNSRTQPIHHDGKIPSRHRRHYLGRGGATRWPGGVGSPRHDDDGGTWRRGGPFWYFACCAAYSARPGGPARRRSRGSPAHASLPWGPVRPPPRRPIRETVTRRRNRKTNSKTKPRKNYNKVQSLFSWTWFTECTCTNLLIYWALWISDTQWDWAPRAGADYICPLYYS